MTQAEASRERMGCDAIGITHTAICKFIQIFLFNCYGLEFLTHKKE